MTEKEQIEHNNKVADIATLLLTKSPEQVDFIMRIIKSIERFEQEKKDYC